MSLLGRLCESFLEAGWIAAAVLSAFFMNIYTQRMFEPDKASLIRSIAILMVIAWLIKFLETPRQRQEKAASISTAFGISSWERFRHTLLFPAVVFFLSYLISSLLSILPRNSFWGSYDRMQGLYTTSAYFVIFLIAVTHIKTISQVNRLVNAIIYTSVLVMAYGLIQKLGLDPVPWQAMDPTARISSTMGNPIFLAAYLIMVAPLVMAKIISGWVENHPNRPFVWWHWLIICLDQVFLFIIIYLIITSIGKIVKQTVQVAPQVSTTSPTLVVLLSIFIIYTFFTAVIFSFTYEKRFKWAWLKIRLYDLLLILQIVTIFLTQSRGPLIGLAIGLTLFVIVYAVLYKHELLLKVVVSLIIFSSVVGFIFNLPDTPLKPLRKIPFLKDSIIYSSFSHSYLREKLLQLPILERFARVNPREGSARVRMILWETAYKMMRDTLNPPPRRIDATQLPDNPAKTSKIATDPFGYSSLWRFFMGYGPETIGNTFYRYHTSELVEYEGQTTHADNCHNSVINTWINQGIIGVFIFLWLIGMTVWTGFRGLRRLTDPKMLFLLLGLTCAVISHFTESLLGLQIVVTLTHFWIYLALIYYLTTNLPSTVIKPDEEKIIEPVKPSLKKKKDIISQTEPDSFGVFLLKSLFWTYIGVTIVVVLMVINWDWPNMDTNIVNWIVGTYLYILFGLVLGTVSLTVLKIKDKFNRLILGSSFNLIPYLIIIVLAFGLIFYTNLNPILADGFQKFAFSVDAEINRLSPPLQPDKYKAWLKHVFDIRLTAVMHLQRCLKSAASEPTYLNSAGRHLMELARRYSEFVNNGIVLPNPSGRLTKRPTLNEFINFKIEDIASFNDMDFMLCCEAVIYRAWEIEPTNFERLKSMGQVYDFMGQIQRDISKTREYWQKASEIFETTYQVAPYHPDAINRLKGIRPRLAQVMPPSSSSTSLLPPITPVMPSWPIISPTPLGPVAPVSPSGR